MRVTNRQGFTLLELAIVLGILAVLTHLAVREAGRWRDTQLRERANRGLGEIAEAVCGSPFERDAEGVRVRTGFLADMGRLPRAATNGHGGLTLSELWVSPGPQAAYAVRQALAENLPTNHVADADADVWVPGGWRGPYLRMPVGRSRLLDAWGNAYEIPDEAGFTTRLLAASGQAITAAGTPVARVGHFGADGIPDGTRPPVRPDDADLSVALDDASESTLVVTVNVYDSGGASAGVYPATVRVYSPDGDGGIRVHKAASTGTVTVQGLTPGPRVMRVECNGRKGAVRTLTLQPGVNVATEKITITD